MCRIYFGVGLLSLFSGLIVLGGQVAFERDTFLFAGSFFTAIIFGYGGKLCAHSLSPSIDLTAEHQVLFLKENEPPASRFTSWWQDCAYGGYPFLRRHRKPCCGGPWFPHRLAVWLSSDHVLHFRERLRVRPVGSCWEISLT